MGKKMAVSMDQRFVFLGAQKGLFSGGMPPGVSICSDRAGVEAAISGMAKSVTWISLNRTFTDMLLDEVVDARADVKGSHMITLTPPRTESIPALVGLFHPVFGLVEGFHWLGKEDLVEAITRDDAADRFIGGSVDHQAKTLTLLRGDVTVVVAPFSLFPPAGDGTTADFSRLELTDYGKTVALGDYEASADAILYEVDPGYRRKLNKQRRQSEKTFGSSLMRLRKQRRLKRSDFAPVSAKEIARLERNEVATPHAKTMAAIAGRLGVRVEEIGGY
jgi:hypothetical protein